METKISLAARVELANAIRRRYRIASGKEKRKILDEFIAVSGYHPKSAIRALNAQPKPKRPQTRRRPSLYDDAARKALIVLWEASDRLCGKRLRPLLRILLPALERHGHLQLDEAIQTKVLAMSAATIDRLLRTARDATGTRKPRRVTPEIRRRIPVRTFADWNEPPPGSMEMDLVAHCGEVNKGSYVNSLVLTDIASGWTECTPLVVRESGLLIEALERIRIGLPFALRALDVDNGSEFVNEAMIRYCLRNGIEFTRSRPYRKNDQAWIEQKNGAIVRKHLGYRRFEGIAAAQVLARLYGASRLFENFFQPSFKLAEKHRQGAHVTKRYHPPQTPCERLLQAETLPDSMKVKLREVGNALDPLKLLEEVRAMQSHLVELANGGKPDVSSVQEPNLPVFLASLSSAWRAGEVRPTHSAEAQPRYLRPLQAVVRRDTVAPRQPVPPPQPKVVQTPPAIPAEKIPERPQLIYAERGTRAFHALAMVWPLVCRRLEGFPNINSTQLFEELCNQFPGRFHPWHLKRLTERVKVWRQDARARGVVIGRLKYRCPTKKPRGRGPGPQRFTAHWPEMLQCLEARPDQTAAELLTEFQARYPEFYSSSHLRTLRRRLQVWRRQTIQRLICEMQDFTQDVGSGAAA